MIAYLSISASPTHGGDYHAPSLSCCSTGAQSFDGTLPYELVRWDGSLQPWWHGDSTRPWAQPVQSLECLECVNDLASRRKQHERLHSSEQPLGRPDCHERFVGKGDLNAHTADRPYGCPVCPKRFRSKANRQCHLRTHTGERPFACSECPKRFYESRYLRMHLRTHTGETPYACPECPRRFSQRSNLKTHLLTHAGERPYGCNECPKRFYTNSHARRHLRVHTGERPYACSECPRRFNQKGNLNKHRLTHRGERLHHCMECAQCLNKSQILRDQLTHRISAILKNSSASVRAPIAVPALTAGLWFGGYGTPSMAFPPLGIDAHHARTDPATLTGLALDLHGRSGTQ